MGTACHTSIHGHILSILSQLTVHQSASKQGKFTEQNITFGREHMVGSS